MLSTLAAHPAVSFCGSGGSIKAIKVIYTGLTMHEFVIFFMAL
jgi:hypothetical protein